MTISSTTSQSLTPCNGTTTNFAFPNKIFSASDLAATLIDVSGNLYAFIASGVNTFTNSTTGLSYTVFNIDVDNGFFIVFSAAPTNGWSLDMRTTIAELQSTSIKNQGSFFPELHEEFFDRITRELQDLRRLSYTFGIHGPDIETTPWPALPIAALRKNTQPIFDNNGLPAIGILSATSLSTSALAPYLGLSQTIVEIAASVTPINLQYAPLDPRRYATIANWAAVYAATSAAADTDWPFYRGDHAQHPSQTNCIIGYKTYDDSQEIGTIGYRCTAVGVTALQQNKTSTVAGGSNSAFGYASLQSNIEGSGNSGFGAFTLNALTGIAGTDSSHHNNAFGYRTWSALTTGSQNNGFGFQAGNSLLLGNNNHAFGESSLFSLVNGNGNICFGYQAGYGKTNGDFTHAIGYQALFNEASATISGISVAASAVITLNTISAINPFLVNCNVVVEGITTGMTQINGVQGLVTAIGGASGAWTVTTNINSLGFTAWSAGGFLAPLGNTCVGYQTGENINYAGGNTVMGWQAGQSAAMGINNCLYGWQAGFALNGVIGGNLGSYNIAIGWQSLLRGTSCNDVITIGQQAGNFVTTGSEHVIIGSNAGQAVTTVANNVWVGSSTGVNLNGNNNTGCGYNSGSQGGAQTYTNTGSFGANAVPTASNQITLGDSGIATLRCQVTVITALSDERFKKNVAPLVIPDGALEDLDPVIFEWIDDTMPQGIQVGFIAQALDRWQDKWDLRWLNLVDKSNPDRWEATPHKLFPLVLQKMQQQEKRLKAIEAKLGL